MADRPRGRRGQMRYRLMLWEYAVEDMLHVDPPAPHLALVPLKPGMTVVDWGCGPGRYTVPLARAVGPQGKVYAVDVQPLAIGAVRRRVARAGLHNVELLLSEGYAAPIPSASVDIAVMLDMFHAVDDRIALLREVRRLLKPEGLLFMDPGHMPMAKAIEAIEGSGSFTLTRAEGKHMFLKPA